VSAPQTSSATPNEAAAVTAGLLALTLVLLASTFDLRASSAMVPRLVGVPLVLLLAYRLFRDMAARRAYRRNGSGGPSRPRSGEAGAILWLLALPAISTLFGFVAGPALFVFAWARWRGGERVAVAAAAGAVAAGAILLMFVYVLGSPLWPGVLGDLW